MYGFAGPANPDALPARARGQWNELEIHAQGQAYTVFLNGAKITEYASPGPARHGGPELHRPPDAHGASRVPQDPEQGAVGARGRGARARERPEGHAPRRLRVPHLTPEHPPMIWGGIGAAVGGSVAASARAGIAAGVLLVGGALVPGGGGYSSPRPSAGRASYDLRIVAHDEGVEFFQVSRRRPWRAGEVRPHRDQVHSTGWLVPEEVVAWYRAADVLVVPSRYEGLGMRLILNGRA